MSVWFAVRTRFYNPEARFTIQMSASLHQARFEVNRRPCPVCKACEGELHLRKADLRLVRCPACRMVYADPVPHAYATGEYYNLEASDYYLSADKLQSDYSPVRFARELRLFRRWCPSGDVLDVGCSSGGFLYQLLRRYPGDYNLLGTDVSEGALDYAASQGVPIVKGDFVAHDFGPARFDAVTFWAVLEHLAAPDFFLRKARAVLRAGGLCFIIVPNYRSLAVRVLGGRYRYIYPQHLNYFARTTLHRFCRDWKIEFIGCSHFNPVVIWQDWRRGGCEVSNQARGALLKTTTGLKANPALAPLRLLYTMVEWSLGKLFLADNLIAVLRAT